MKRSLGESLGRGYKPWLMASVALLVGSLGVLAVAAAVAFVQYADAPAPIWLVLLGLAAALGVAGGFAGMFVLVGIAGVRSFREGRKVQVLSPEHSDKV